MKARLPRFYSSQPPALSGELTLFDSSLRPLWWSSITGKKSYHIAWASGSAGTLRVYLALGGGWFLHSSAESSGSGVIDVSTVDIRAAQGLRVTYENTGGSAETFFGYDHFVSNTALQSAEGVPATPIPETIANTMALWIDTDPTYLTSDVGRCSSFVTRDSNAWVFTAPGESAEPLSQATGLLSRPALYWTTDDYMICTGGLAEVLDGTQAYEEFVVGELDSAGGPGVVYGVGGVGSTTANQYVASYFVNGVDTVTRRGAGTTTNTGTGAVGADPFIWAHNFSGSVVNFWVNDAQTITDEANTQSVAGDVYTLGALRTFGSYNSFYKGTIAEKIVYLGVLSTEDRAALWAYFAAKYVGLVVPS